MKECKLYDDVDEDDLLDDDRVIKETKYGQVTEQDLDKLANNMFAVVTDVGDARDILYYVVADLSHGHVLCVVGGVVGETLEVEICMWRRRLLKQQWMVPMKALRVFFMAALDMVVELTIGQRTLDLLIWLLALSWRRR